MRDDSVHAEIGQVFIVLVVGLDGGGDHVGDMRVFFGQLGGEVHFFPSVLFLQADSREAEFRADAFAFNEVDVAVLLINRKLLMGCL